MHLSLAGHPLHTRSLTVAMSVVAGGRWHARGEIIDLRKCNFIPMMANIQPAGIIHHMRIELELDPRSLRMERVTVDQPVVPIEASAESRGESCRDPAPKLEAFAGEALDEDFGRKLSASFRGALGCSHLLALFQLMADAVRRGARMERLHWADPGVRQAGERFFCRSLLIDGVDDEAGDIGLGLQLGDFHSRPSSETAHPIERLAQEDSVRIAAGVAVPQMTLRNLTAASRSRSGDRLSEGTWESQTDIVAPFEGLPSMGGLASRILAALGDDEEHELLLAALLQLAPANIQVLAATLDRYIAAPREAPDSTSDAAGGISLAAFGGMADSCYMWRSGGASLKSREAVQREFIETGDPD